MVECMLIVINANIDFNYCNSGVILWKFVHYYGMSIHYSSDYCISSQQVKAVKFENNLRDSRNKDPISNENVINTSSTGDESLNNTYNK